MFFQIVFILTKLTMLIISLSLPFCNINNIWVETRSWRRPPQEAHLHPFSRRRQAPSQEEAYDREVPGGNKARGQGTKQTYVTRWGIFTYFVALLLPRLFLASFIWYLPQYILKHRNLESNKTLNWDFMRATSNPFLPLVSIILFWARVSVFIN